LTDRSSSPDVTLGDLQEVLAKQAGAAQVKEEDEELLSRPNKNFYKDGNHGVYDGDHLMPATKSSPGHHNLSENFNKQNPFRRIHDVIHRQNPSV
jgi:hypothetical protein